MCYQLAKTSTPHPPLESVSSLFLFYREECLENSLKVLNLDDIFLLISNYWYGWKLVLTCASATSPFHFAAIFQFCGHSCVHTNQVWWNSGNCGGYNVRGARIVEIKLRVVYIFREFSLYSFLLLRFSSSSSFSLSSSASSCCKYGEG